MEHDMKEFLDKECRLTLNNGFTLRGYVTSYNIFGVYFKTKQKKAYHAFSNIKEIVPMEDVEDY